MRRATATNASNIDGAVAREVAWRRRALAAATLLGVCSIGLMAQAPVHRVAFAAGSLQPKEEMVVLKHVSGGEVAAVMAAVNERVSAGAPLLRLEDADLSAERARLAIRRAHSDLKRERLQALIDAAPFHPTPRPGLTNEDFASARRLHLAERTDLASALATLDARLTEARGTARAMDAALKSLRAELASHGERAEMTSHLHARRVGTRSAHLSAQAQIAETEQRLAETQGRSEAAASLMVQLEHDRRKALARRRADWSLELAETAREIADLTASIARLDREIGELLVAAPIDGRVLELGAATRGDVLAPGGLVARIVPAARGGREEIVADIRIAPEDIGYVAVGDSAEVTVTAFETEIFGKIHGRVREISPSSLMGEDGTAYYSAKLDIDRTTARLGDRTLALGPGMVVQAKLSAADGYLLGYLMEPVTKSLERAFSE